MTSSESCLKELPKSTVRLLGSTQVITSVYSVVKELVENACDACSNNIDIKLDNYGLDKIEVRDNGSGIQTQDVPFVAKRYFTSKIECFEDLQSIRTYGFRGEALGSLCSVSTLAITTRTKDDDISLTYSINSSGEITGSKPSHLTQGTTITATHLFKNLPVRRQMYNTAKKKKEDFQRVEKLLISYGLIHPAMRITLRHNKEVVWQKHSTKDTTLAVSSIFGRQLFDMMEFKTRRSDSPQISIEAFLPGNKSKPLMSSKPTNERCYVFVNKRLIFSKDIEKLLKKFYSAYHRCETSRYPVCFVSLVVDQSELDVNLDPNKSQVYLQHEDNVMLMLTSILEEVYGSLESIKSEDSNEVNNPDLHQKPELSIQINTSLSSLDSSDESFTKIIQVTSAMEKDNMPVFKVTPDNLNSNDRHFPETSEKSKATEIFSLDDEVYSSGSSKKVTEPHKEKLEDDKQPETVVLSKPDLGKNNNSQCTTPSIGNCILPKMHFDIGDPALPTMDVDKGCAPRKDENSSSIDISASQRGNFDILDESYEEVALDIPVDKQLASDTVDQDKSLNNNSIYSFTEFLDESMSDESAKAAPVVSNNANSDAKESTTTEVCGTTKESNSEPANTTEVCRTTKELNSEPAKHLCPESWSKGQGLTTNSGRTIQPVTLLTGNMKRPTNSPPDVACSPPVKKRFIQQEEGQLSLPRMIQESPVIQRRADTAFTTFCKEVRSKVVEENPAASFNDITEILKDKWNDMPSADKDSYVQSPCRNVQLSCTNVQLSTPDQGDKKLFTKPVARKLGRRLKLSQNKTGLSIKDQLKAVAEKIKQKEVKPVTKVVDFSVKHLQKTFSSGLNKSQNQIKDREVIGFIKGCMAWITVQGNRISIMNHMRLQETVLYHRLMSDHNLPKTDLENPIKLSEKAVGGAKFWEILLSLSQSSLPGETYTYVTDDRIAKNGFKIRVYSDQETGHKQADVVSLADYIPTYGFCDLAEVLELICNTEASSISKSRPLKVLNYLKGEAVRIARQLPRYLTRQEAVDLLDEHQTVLPAGCEVCLHNKQFFSELYDLDSLPMTQSQTSPASLKA